MGGEAKAESKAPTWMMGSALGSAGSSRLFLWSADVHIPQQLTRDEVCAVARSICAGFMRSGVP